MAFCPECQLAYDPVAEACPHCYPPVRTCPRCLTDLDPGGECACCPWCLDLTWGECGCADDLAYAAYERDLRDSEDAYYF
ncbi:hypothetical protein AB0A73_24455 [Glycomyces sp. NPDC047369]